MRLVKRRRVPDILGLERRTAIPTDEIEQTVVRALDGLGIPYERVPIDPEYADTAAFCARYGFPLERSANTIIVASKKEPRQFAACVVRADRRLDVNHTVRKLMSVSRLSFADADDTRVLTGMMIGGVTVLALPESLPIYVDDTLMAFDWIILGGGSRSLKIKISPAVFSRIAAATIVPGLSQGP
jgi:prolyl-tRNA editing enzyme YbaK/EbsC (Cys-tRNA(Pro) deacylase)